MLILIVSSCQVVQWIWLFEHLNGTEEWVPCLLRIESVTALSLLVVALWCMFVKPIWKEVEGMCSIIIIVSFHVGLVWLDAWLQLALCGLYFGLIFEWWIQGVVHKPFSWWTPYWPYNMFIIYICVLPVIMFSIVRLNYVVCCKFALANITSLLFLGLSLHLSQVDCG